MDGLLECLADEISPLIQAYAILPLTILDPTRGNGECLNSAVAYSRRGFANEMLGLNQEALEDMNAADKIKVGDVFNLW